MSISKKGDLGTHLGLEPQWKSLLSDLLPRKPIQKTPNVHLCQ